MEATCLSASAVAPWTSFMPNSNRKSMIKSINCSNNHVAKSSSIHYHQSLSVQHDSRCNYEKSEGSRVDRSTEGLGIAKFFEQKRFLVTGATGFLAKVLLEKILRIAPDVGVIYVLVKAKDEEAAAERLKREILNTELFRCVREMHGDHYKDFMMRKLIPVVGNIEEDNIGIGKELAREISKEVDVIINSAANTVFDERYDVALDINTLGPSRLMNFARRCEKLKLFLHVSTAYVNGRRQGRILEKPFGIGDSIRREEEPSGEAVPLLDIDSEIELAFSHRKRFSGVSLVQEMKALGFDRAKIYGWQNCYEFTKAMGETMISSSRGNIPVVIIRPSIVESTYKEPFPGCIQGNRMMDPIILLYGKGELSGFLFDPNGVIDVVPVDMVVNATLAAMAKHGSRVSTPGMHIYQITASVANPLVFQDLAKYVFQHYSSFPWKDSRGRPIVVSPPKFFSSINEFYSYTLNDALRRTEQFTGSISNEKNSLRMEKKYPKSVEQAKHLAKIYEPYAFYKGRFDSTNTRKLWEEMSEQERRSFGFDVDSIDWADYITFVHVPGLRRNAKRGRETLGDSKYLNAIP